MKIGFAHVCAVFNLNLLTTTGGWNEEVESDGSVAAVVNNGIMADKTK